MRRLISKLYHFTRLFLETFIIGTKLEQFIWSTYHIHYGKRWLEEQWDSRNSRPQIRKMLQQKISTYSPLSILEIGCGAGQYLVYLHQFFPNAELYGIDINKKAIDFGNKKINELGIKNIKLFHGKADNLSQFQNKSVDLIFTAGLMIYIGKDLVSEVGKQIIRVARKGIIMIELQAQHNKKDPRGLGYYRNGHWLRNYSDLFEGLGIPKNKIYFTKITAEIISDNWAQSGYFIEINFRNFLKKC